MRTNCQSVNPVLRLYSEDIRYQRTVLTIVLHATFKSDSSTTKVGWKDKRRLNTLQANKMMLRINKDSVFQVHGQWKGCSRIRPCYSVCFVDEFFLRSNAWHTDVMRTLQWNCIWEHIAKAKCNVWNVVLGQEWMNLIIQKRRPLGH